jgi:hypothetical protein
MQVGIALILLVGLARRNVGVVVNATFALAATALPAVLERDYRLPLDAGLTLWITAALFLHTIGMLGLYDGVWWWDHLTHTLSATIVAAVGYVTARAVDESSEDIYLPRPFLFVYIVLFTLALGVLWEVLEFAARGGADLLGIDPVLVQYGLSDSLLDLVFDAVGAVVVGLFGAGVFEGVATTLADRLDGRLTGTLADAAGSDRDGDRPADSAPRAPARVPLEAALRTAPDNARRAWAVTAGLVFLVPGGVALGEPLWAGVAAVTTAVVVAPAVAYRTPRVMPPWPLLVLVVLPAVARLLSPGGALASLTTYVAVATVALLLAVELHRFTAVAMTPWFAVVTVVVATMATAGVWAVARWLLDVTLGTQFLLVPGVPPSAIETGIMWDFVYSAVAGLLAGVVFQYGFRRSATGGAARRYDAS